MNKIQGFGGERCVVVAKAESFGFERFGHPVPKGAKGFIVKSV